MAQDRTEQRAELHRSLKQMAEDLRGAVTGWDFKMYVLGTLFYRFLSERMEKVADEGEREANPDGYIPYAEMDDETAQYGRESLIEEVGYYIAPSDLFCNVWAKAVKDDKEKEHTDLNETIARILGEIQKSAEGHDSYKDLQGLFEDYDTNSSKLGLEVDERNENLLALLNAVGGLQLGVGDTEIDTFGDAYEYLISMYAANAGKSGGEYFTPVEVGRLIAKLATCGKKTIRKAYDPTCGSASLLIRAADEVGHENVKIGLFGQEKEPFSYNIGRINMFLHDIPFNKFDIALGNTLTDPQHWDDQPFDCIVANMPFSTSWPGDSDPELVDDPRFNVAGVLAPQKKKADLAFVMHMAAWLADDGTCATVIFNGALYRSNDAEQKIRKYLVDEGLVSAIIQLPSNLFFGTSIPTSILIMRGSRDCNDVLFIDATNECVKSGNKNMLTDENIEHIVDTFEQRDTVDKFCRVVDISEVAENSYNLSVNTYVDTSEEKEIADTFALAEQAAEIVERQAEFRKKVDAFISDYEGWS